MNRLPTRFGLHAVGEAAGSAGIRNPSDETSESVRPVGIGHKKTQDRTAEEFAPRADLRGDGEFAEPAAMEAVARGHTIEAWFQRERNVIGEKELRSGAEGVPLRGTVLRLPVARPLVDEERHDGELRIWLDQTIFLE